jgi:hypothetical protein
MTSKCFSRHLRQPVTRCNLISDPDTEGTKEFELDDGTKKH